MNHFILLLITVFVFIPIGVIYEKIADLNKIQQTNCTITNFALVNSHKCQVDYLTIANSKNHSFDYACDIKANCLLVVRNIYSNEFYPCWYLKDSPNKIEFNSTYPIATDRERIIGGIIISMFLLIIWVIVVGHHVSKAFKLNNPN